MSSLPLGNSGDLTGFSPADFGDAEDTRPMAIQLDPTGYGLLTPYSTLVNNAYQRQTVELREKTVNPSPTPSNWKRRFSEFMQTKHEDLLGFLHKPSSASSPIGKATHFFQKFGRPDFQATHPSLQTTFLDGSGGSLIPSLAVELQQIGPSSPKEILDQVRWVYDMYKEAGEACFRAEAALKVKLDVLDKMHSKILGLCDLPTNEESDAVAHAVEVYMKKLMEEQKIEEEYKAAIEAYRRFAALRELITFFRFTELQLKEPLCTICLSDTVTFAASPCGHTFCSTCIKRQNNLCFMCRTTIRDRVKIYFG